MPLRLFRKFRSSPTRFGSHGRRADHLEVRRELRARFFGNSESDRQVTTGEVAARLIPSSKLSSLPGALHKQNGTLDAAAPEDTFGLPQRPARTQLQIAALPTARGLGRLLNQTSMSRFDRLPWDSLPGSPPLCRFGMTDP